MLLAIAAEPVFKNSFFHLLGNLQIELTELRIFLGIFLELYFFTDLLNIFFGLVPFLVGSEASGCLELPGEDMLQFLAGPKGKEMLPSLGSATCSAASSASIPSNLGISFMTSTRPRKIFWVMYLIFIGTL